MRTGKLAVLLAIPLALLACVLPARSAPPTRPSPRVDMASLPLTFVQNNGQFPATYAFAAQSGAVETMLGPEGADIFLPIGQGRTDRIGFRLIGQSPAVALSGAEPMAGVSNYFRGADPSRWVAGAHHYGKVMFPQVYPGIDLAFHGAGDRLEDDFLLAPGAPASRIAFRLDGGADRVTISPQGDLIIQRGTSTVVFKKPVAFQENGPHRTEVQATYRITKDGTVRFRLGRYDRARSLVIDPVVIFSTYFAGPYNITGMATDSTANIYITGTVSSTALPTVSPEQAQPAGGGDVFVSKFDPTGHTLLFSTYLGGSGLDLGGSIAISPKGNVVLSGVSGSQDFPHAGAINSPPGCQCNYQWFFLTSFTPDGSSLVYSGTIGGRPNGFVEEQAIAPITVDSQNNTYLTGVSSDASFQLTRAR